jgi:hypothetical protein
MANKRRTRQQWADIIEHWAQSGLTSKQYCEQHNLVLQTFHARRSDIKRGVQNRSRKFVNVIRDKPVENVMSQGVMMMRFQGCELHLNSPQSAAWFADLMKRLVS